MCQTVWILIWVQNVCKGHQQTIKVASKEIVNIDLGLGTPKTAVVILPEITRFRALVDPEGSGTGGPNPAHPWKITTGCRIL